MTNSINAYEILTEVDERAGDAHREMWHAFDAPVRWMWEQELTVSEAIATLRVLTEGGIHAESTRTLCARLEEVERLIGHVTAQVDASRIRAAAEAQHAVYREARDAS